MTKQLLQHEDIGEHLPSTESHFQARNSRYNTCGQIWTNRILKEQKEQTCPTEQIIADIEFTKHDLVIILSLAPLKN